MNLARAPSRGESMRETVEFRLDAPFVGTEPGGAGVPSVGGAAPFLDR